jgi:hypothetical protein
MPLFNISADATEFAVATGSNVASGNRTSGFDGPPVQTSGLTITPRSGDADPRLFAVGDTYDLSWTGPDGPMRLDGAEVLRSDMAPGGNGGVVVFSGQTPAGDTVHLLWTPGFDIQAWYDSVGGRASFFTFDQQAGYTHSYVCFAAETRIATPYGPCPAGLLAAGDHVLTRDHGPLPLRWVGMRRMAGLGQGAPVAFAPGAFGSTGRLRLSRQHRVLVVSPRAELLFGASEVLLPAGAFDGMPRVRSEPVARITWVHLLLDRHEIVEAEGVPCESLFLGPVGADLIGRPACLRGGGASALRHDRTARPVLSWAEARCLLGLPAGRGAEWVDPLGAQVRTAQMKRPRAMPGPFQM